MSPYDEHFVGFKGSTETVSSTSPHNGVKLHQWCQVSPLPTFVALASILALAIDSDPLKPTMCSLQLESGHHLCNYFGLLEKVRATTCLPIAGLQVSQSGIACSPIHCQGGLYVIMSPQQQKVHKQAVFCGCHVLLVTSEQYVSVTTISSEILYMSLVKQLVLTGDQPSELTLLSAERAPSA